MQKSCSRSPGTSTSQWLPCKVECEDIGVSTTGMGNQQHDALLDKRCCIAARQLTQVTD